MMDLGRDPEEGIFSIFRVDCSLVVGLCFYNHYYTLSTASREWALYGAALYRKCLKYLSCSPRSYVDPTLLPRNQ